MEKEMEEAIQRALDALTVLRETVIANRFHSMQADLETIFDATNALMAFVNDYELDVFTTLPYDG